MYVTGREADELTHILNTFTPPSHVTVRETGELLRPILRFGIPETSVRNKCKYWR